MDRMRARLSGGIHVLAIFSDEHGVVEMGVGVDSLQCCSEYLGIWLEHPHFGRESHSCRNWLKELPDIELIENRNVTRLNALDAVVRSRHVEIGYQSKRRCLLIRRVHVTKGLQDLLSAGSRVSSCSSVSPRSKKTARMVVPRWSSNQCRKKGPDSIRSPVTSRRAFSCPVSSPSCSRSNLQKNPSSRTKISRISASVRQQSR